MSRHSTSILSKPYFLFTQIKVATNYVPHRNAATRHAHIRRGWRTCKNILSLQLLLVGSGLEGLTTKPKVFPIKSNGVQVISYPSRGGEETVAGRPGTKERCMSPSDANMNGFVSVLIWDLGDFSFIVPLLVHGTPFMRANIEPWMQAAQSTHM